MSLGFKSDCLLLSFSVVSNDVRFDDDRGFVFANVQFKGCSRDDEWGKAPPTVALRWLTAGNVIVEVG